MVALEASPRLPRPLEEGGHHGSRRTRAFEGDRTTRSPGSGPGAPRRGGSLADEVYKHRDPEAFHDLLKDKALKEIPEHYVEGLADDKRGVIELRSKIAESERQLAEIKGSLVEKFEPRAEDLLEVQIEEIDDRPTFPEVWLRDQIVAGRVYLASKELTDSSSISRQLKGLMRDG